jgi:hypothetical protein
MIELIDVPADIDWQFKRTIERTNREMSNKYQLEAIKVLTRDRKQFCGTIHFVIPCYHYELQIDDLVFHKHKRKIDNISKKFGVKQPIQLTEESFYNLLEANTEQFLAVVYEEIEKNGWVSKTSVLDKFRNQNSDPVALANAPLHEATFYKAWEVLKVKALKYDFTIAEAHSKDFAKRALEWIRNFPANEAYLKVLKECAQRKTVSYRKAGLVASLIPTFKRQIEKPEGPKSKYIGEVGEKVQVIAKVTKKHPCAFCTLWSFEDSNGNMLVSFPKKNPEISVGDIIELEGKVKQHKEYRDVKQTILNYIKVQKLS